MNSDQNKIKRYFGITLILILTGFIKILIKGYKDEQGNIDWFDVLFPGGIGAAFGVFTLILYINQYKSRKV